MTDNSGAAYPHIRKEYINSMTRNGMVDVDVYDLGMTKREVYFRAIAQGMASSNFWAENMTLDETSVDRFIKVAMFVAEKMVAESQKKKGK
jgi:hypothetical protein